MTGPTSRSRTSLLARIADAVARALGHVILWAAVAFIAVPGLLVLLLSFSADPYVQFPPSSFGFDQYEAFFTSRIWLDAMRLSLVIGLLTVALSLVISVPATFVVFRTRMPARHALLVLGVAGILIPGAAYAVALYGLYSRMNLLGTVGGLVIAHSLLAVPMALLVLGSAIVRIPRDLELVAMTLGANRWQAMAGITLRLLSPAVFAAGIMAFLTSFDEAVFVNFLGGVGLVTIPKAIFDSVRYGLDPTITAIAGTLIALSAVLMGLRGLVERRTTR